MRRRPSGRGAYWSIIIFLGLTALGCYLGSLTDAVERHPELQRLLQAVADGFLVAFIVAAFVEPYLRSRFLHEMHHEVMWGLLNPDASDEHKDAIQELAQEKHIFKSAHWRLNFDWEDKAKGIVALTIEARNDGVSYETGGYAPKAKLWVLGSTEGYRSRYLEWTMTVPSSDEWRKENTFNEAQLTERGYATEQDDGRIFVDEAKIAGRRKIVKGEHYSIVRKAVMYRHHVGYVPLAYGRPTLSAQIVVDGDALEDLEVTMFHPSRLGTDPPPQERRTGESGPPFSIGHVVMPGQASLVTWRLRRDPLFDADELSEADVAPSN